MKKYLIKSGYDELIAAIVVQACKDYVKARILLINDRESLVGKHMYADCMRFFNSADYSDLMDLDSSVILKRLDESIKRKYSKKKKLTLNNLCALNEFYGMEFSINDGKLAR